MAKEYSVAEEALKQRILVHFDEYIQDEHIESGDLDRVIAAMVTDDNPYGVLLEMVRGRDPLDDTFEKARWIWTVGGVFFIRYSDAEQVEVDLRKIVDLLPSLLDGFHRLGNTAVFSRITIVDTPEPSLIGEMSMYWLPFVVDIWVQ